MKITGKTICYAIINETGKITGAVCGPNAERKAISDSSAMRTERMTVGDYIAKTGRSSGLVAPADAQWTV